MPQPVKFILNWGRKYSLWVMNFGLACCAIEFIATLDLEARLHPASASSPSPTAPVRPTCWWWPGRSPTRWPPPSSGSTTRCPTRST